MKNIFIAGAGRSSGSLINYLLQYAQKGGLQVTVADVSEELAAEKTGNHPAAKHLAFDVQNIAQRNQVVSSANVVISLLPPHLHQLLAEACVNMGVHFISASYLSPEMKNLHQEASRKGVLLLNECGLDPGIDHMSAMELFHRIKNEGGELASFKSYTGGLVAPESNDNPWGYKFSWNPRNVILSGQGTARYILDGKYKYIPYSRLFTDIETVHIDGLGAFDGYANRDSLSYRQLYQIDTIPTLLRGTLRQTGFCRAWDIFVRLGLTDDSYLIEKPDSLTYAQLVESLLPSAMRKESLVEAVASLCQLPVEGEAMTRVAWTGIFEDKKINLKEASPAMILQNLLEQKWKLLPGDKDMVVMQHQVEYILQGARKKIISSLVVKGESGGQTAMSKTVGLPLAIVTRLLIENKLRLSGVHIPVSADIYKPVLGELDQLGITFREQSQ